MFNENNWLKYNELYAVCLYGVLREFDTLSLIIIMNSCCHLPLLLVDDTGGGGGLDLDIGMPTENLLSAASNFSSIYIVWLYRK